MKLLHTSDWHLGMTSSGGMSYAEDQKFFIDSICSIAKNNNIDAVLIAGDVFDKSIASQDALALYDYALNRLCLELDMTVYIIAGNHDGANRLASCSELLKKSGLYVSGSLKSEIEVNNMGDVDIYMLPWITTDKVRGVFPDLSEEVNSIEDAYRVVLDKYRESFVSGHKNILISHAYIVDAQLSDSDKAAEIGKATMVSASVFDGFDYVALGHIHGPQTIRENIRYSGTPMPYSFGKEEKQEKSVTIIDTDTMTTKIIPLPVLRSRTTLTGTFDELLKADYEEDIVNGYMKIVVTDIYVGLEGIAMLREAYPNMLEVSGKDLELEGSKITMTMDEFEKAVTDPQIIFSRYCEDILGEKPSEHLIGLFEDALKLYEKELGEA